MPYQLNILVFKPNDFYSSFLVKMCLLLLKIYMRVATFICIQNNSITDREMIFAVLDRSVNCLCSSIKDKTQ